MRKEGFFGMPTREGWIGAIAAASLMFGSVASADDSCRALQMKGYTVNCMSSNGLLDDSVVGINLETKYPPHQEEYASAKNCSQFFNVIQNASIKNGGTITLSIKNSGECSLEINPKEGSK